MILVKLACLATFVIAATAACASSDEIEPPIPNRGPKDSTSLSPSYAAKSSGSLGNQVDVDALEWTRNVNHILAAEVSSEQPLSDLVCFFSVSMNGKIVGEVKFSRALEPARAKRMTDKIMHASPLPAIAGAQMRKVYFEIAKHGDTCVGFAK